MGSVGESPRTPGKRKWFNTVMGRDVGVMSTDRVQRRLTNYMVIDMTAGDGAVGSSAECAVRHVSWLREQWGLDEDDVGACVRLFERDAEAFETLVDAIGPERPWLSIAQGDSKDLIRTIPAPDANTAVLLVDDPNTPKDRTLTEDVLRHLFSGTAWAITLLSTIGANCEGRARMFNLRSVPEPMMPEHEYTDYVQAVSSIGSHRESVMCVLDGDPAKWGYLAITSQRFAGREAASMLKAFNNITIATFGRPNVLRPRTVTGRREVMATIPTLYQSKNRGTP